MNNKEKAPEVLDTNGSDAIIGKQSEDTKKLLDKLLAKVKQAPPKANFPKNITEQYVYCSKAIVDVASKQGAVFLGNFVCVNNKWQEVENFVFKDFLEKCAIKIGMDEFKIMRDASLTNFKKEFNSYCQRIYNMKHKINLPEPPEKKVEEENKLTPIETTAKLLKENYPDTTFNIVSEKANFIKGASFDEVIAEIMKLNNSVTPRLLEMVLRNPKDVKQIDPFIDYFESDSIANGWQEGDKDYITNLANCVQTTNQPFFNSMFKKHLVRSVGQATLKSKYPNRIVLVMQSKAENIGKSTFIRYLNPFGEEYHIEHIDNDIELAITKVFIFNIEELEEMSSKSFNQMKAIVSKENATIRRLYTQQYFSKPRRANFFASTNELEFLGKGENSRWLIINVEAVNFGYDNPKDKENYVDINKVWAQATYLFKNGFNTSLTKEEWIVAKSQSKEHRYRSNEEEYITSYLQPSKSHFATATEIEIYLNSTDYQSRVKAVTIGKTLQGMGYERIKRSGNYGYLIETVNGTDISEENIRHEEDKNRKYGNFG